MSLVSVIIPNYNHGRFLSERIESVLNQSFTDFECIVLDDASTDNSKEIIEGFAARDSRIKFYPSENNSGSPFVQWNRGVALASNELIWIAESDDSCDTDLLQTLVNEHLQNPNIGIAYCQSLKIDAVGNIEGTWQDFTNNMDAEQFKEKFIMDGKEFIDRFLIYKNVIPNASAVIFRKDTYEKICGADFDLKSNGDWLVWLKMLCHGKVSFVAKPFNYFRMHDDSVIGKLRACIDDFYYREQYDRTPRVKFSNYLYSNTIKVSTRSEQISDLFISYDDGNEGLFLIKNREYLQGLKKIISATFKPKFKSGYLKKMIRF